MLEFPVNQPFNFTKANGVAHWGRTKKKTAINKTSLSGNVYPASAPFVAASSVPSWNPQYPWILNANLTVAEAEMLASHLEQQRLIWLWNREVWTQHTGYNLSGWNASVGDEGWGNHNNND
ncbi:hypothetical protein N7457_003203 [Penicillium paradoxum]|uniref:uncharacterized protein n=1 Tax=Penicillium paradoxum TaxID=176176 RepID=UPI002547AC79|nr:uncharacterized protein N7457_003203 [Penicillium paradoxum]KAJ5788213.1 hypothetical protein N7457_003203 [Penicillium paradoxum]